MKQFIFVFIGRQKNAIGCRHDCRQIVLAETKEEAELKLYDTHEHISELECVREHEITP